MNKRCKSAATKLALLAGDAEVMLKERKDRGERLSEVYLEGLIAGYKKALELLGEK